ncbi:MAG TPA: alpha/beta fold hydrolase [Polyangiaceae bacterium]|jgi:pimeloyl-ACP methyl ester carboxylesterase
MIHYVDNGAGTELAVRRVAPDKPARARPVLIVPGYGMNSFIFGFHPAERSLEATLASHGLVVYSTDLRGQGKSRSAARASDRYGMAELAVDDIGAVIDFVREREQSDRVDLLGCSLGTSLAFGYLAHAGSNAVGSFVSVGGLVRWVDIPPLLRLAFASPRVAGLVKMRGTRAFARRALPIVSRTFPKLLSLYVNASSSDLARASEIVETVEDPHPIINREIAEWIARRDLILRGVNVSAAIETMTHPLMAVVAKDDGIVPEATSRDVFDRIGRRSANGHAPDRELLVLGGDVARPIAHADLFLSHGAEERIFSPIARFLLDRGAPS